MATLEQLRSRFAARKPSAAPDGGGKPVTAAQAVAQAIEGAIWTPKHFTQWAAKFNPFDSTGTELKLTQEFDVKVTDLRITFGKFTGQKLSDMVATGKGRGYLRFLYGSIVKSSPHPIGDVFQSLLGESHETITKKHNK